MDFDAAVHLQKATGRAKSDVANKLVGMVLHEISRRVTIAAGVSVTDAPYVQAVVAAFGKSCLYCGRSLEKDRAANEHLEAMNRVRVGLHVPGNVAVACVRCNREKRRDDMDSGSTLAGSGWEAFLAHDGTRCAGKIHCRTCAYWTEVWPNTKVRKVRLAETVGRIRDFRAPYLAFSGWNERHRPLIQKKVEALYRECQAFALRGVEELMAGLVLDLGELGEN